VEVALVAQVAEMSHSYYVGASERVTGQSIVGDHCAAEQDAVFGAVGFECLRLQQGVFGEVSSTLLVVVFEVSSDGHRLGLVPGLLLDLERFLFVELFDSVVDLGAEVDVFAYLGH
jgi:hypothetical protein